jgi:phage terminase large subunit
MDITCTRNGNTIIFRGLDDIERVKSIASITQIWIEEASEISEEAFNQLNIRLRNRRETYNNQIILTFNPISQKHWLKKRFFDTKDDDVFTMKTTYKDNPYLPEENIKELEKLKDTSPYYYQVYCLGEWGTIGESVFDRELLGRRMDEVFANRDYKRGYFAYEYTEQMIVRETIRWVDDKDGAITIFREPNDAMPYVIGADTAGMGIDYFAAVVMNNHNGEIEAQYYQDGKDEKFFTDQLYCLGMWYNEAMVNPETNYSTYPVLELARMEYPTLYKREVIGTNDGSRTENRYGFITTKSNRNSILSLVDNYVKENVRTIPSYELLDEMANFIIVETKSKNRKATVRQEAAKGEHDDLIMALGITLFTRDQWEKFPRQDRKPVWKNTFDPLGMIEETEVFTIW